MRQSLVTSAATIWIILQRAMDWGFYFDKDNAGKRMAARIAIMAMTTSNSISVKASRPGWACFAVSSFRLDQSFRGGDFFKRGRVPQAHGPFARARQIVAVRRKSEARNRALVPVKRGRFLH